MIIIFIRHLRITGSDGNLVKYAWKERTAHLIGRWTIFQARKAEVLGKPKCTISGVIRAEGALAGPLSFAKTLFQLYKAWILSKPQDVSLIGGSLRQALFMELLFTQSRRKLYLFSDITRFHMSAIWGPLIRFMEGKMIDRGWIPCVTSPGFYDGYLRPLRPTINPYLLHNVELILYDDLDVPHSPRKGQPRSIAWFGLLRCNQSVAILRHLSKVGVTQAVIAGVTSSLHSDEFQSLTEMRGVRFHGEYSASELQRLYAEASYTWACDWADGVQGSRLNNSMLLIPNRLYQGIAACTPILASRGSWVGRVVAHYKIGIEIDFDPILVENTLRSISEADYNAMRDRILAIRDKVFFKSNPWDLLMNGRLVRLSSVENLERIFEE
jgi:hypothetical protein